MQSKQKEKVGDADKDEEGDAGAAAGDPDVDGADDAGGILGAGGGARLSP